MLETTIGFPSATDTIYKELDNKDPEHPLVFSFTLKNTSQNKIYITNKEASISGQGERLGVYGPIIIDSPNAPRTEEDFHLVIEPGKDYHGLAGVFNATKEHVTKASLKNVQMACRFQYSTEAPAPGRQTTWTPYINFSR